MVVQTVEMGISYVYMNSYRRSATTYLITCYNIINYELQNRDSRHRGSGTSEKQQRTLASRPWARQRIVLERPPTSSLLTLQASLRGAARVDQSMRACGRVSVNEGT